MKDSFLIYNSFYEPIKLLTGSEKAELLDLMFEYNTTGEIHKINSLPVKIIWATMKQQFDRDSIKYQNIAERNKANIAKRWSNKTATKDTNGISGIPKSTKNTDTVSDSVSDSDIKKSVFKDIKRKDKLSSPDRIDYEALMNYFNTTFKGKLPSITQITDKRKAAIKARIGEYGKEAIQKVFNKTLESDFLIGNNDRNWRCDFDWIFKPTSFIKILEGNYENQSKPKSDMILTDNSKDKFKDTKTW